MDDLKKCEIKVTRYKRIVNDLEEILSQYEMTSDMAACAMNQNTVEYYTKVFAWLQTQEWYQNHAHEVRKYTESIVDISPPVLY